MCTSLTSDSCYLSHIKGRPLFKKENLEGQMKRLRALMAIVIFPRLPSKIGKIQMKSGPSDF